MFYLYLHSQYIYYHDGMNSNTGTAESVQQLASKAGALIRTQRRELGLTQAQLANRIGVTIPTLRRLESGDTSISLHTFLAALTELGIADLVLNTANSAPCRSLPSIKPEKRNSFANRLQLQGINGRDAENAAWILSLSDQQRITLLQQQEREQKLCGIALR